MESLISDIHLIKYYSRLKLHITTNRDKLNKKTFYDVYGNSNNLASYKLYKIHKMCRAYFSAVLNFSSYFVKTKN